MRVGGFNLTGEDLEIIMTIIKYKEAGHGRITNNFTCHESQKRTSLTARRLRRNFPAIGPYVQNDSGSSIRLEAMIRP